MLLLLCWCQLRHINHASINIVTSIIGGQPWHGIWLIRWSPTGIEESCNSCVVLGEDLDDSWQTEDSRGVLMTELFNGTETYITGNDNYFLFEWQSLRLNPRLSRGVFCEDLDDRWQTENSWDGLMTELLNGGENISLVMTTCLYMSDCPCN